MVSILCSSHCLLGFCVWSLLCYAFLSFASILTRTRKRESWFECISQSIEKKFLPGMYHVLNYSYSQLERNPSTHSQGLYNI